MAVRANKSKPFVAYYPDYDMGQFATIAEACQMLGCSRSTIRRHMDSGEVSTKTVAHLGFGNRYLLDRRDLERLREQQESRKHAPPAQHLSLNQVAKRFHTSDRTIKQRIDAGLLHATMVDGYYRIDRVEAERVFGEHKRRNAEKATAPDEQYDAECLSGECLTVAEVAELLDQDELTIRRLVVTNEMPSVVVEGRRLVPRAGIERMIEAAERERQAEIEEARRLWARIRRQRA